MNNDLTFSGILDQYFREKPLSTATMRTYKSVLKRFREDTGIEYLRDVRFENLLDWRLDVIERASDITWNNYLRHMRALWKFALERKYIDGDDYFKQLHWGKYKTNATKTISQDQYHSMLRLLDDPGCPLAPHWFWKTVVRFMYFTGIRRLQLVTLKWSDIDWERQTVRLSAEGEKTDFERCLPLEASLFGDLLAYRKRVKQSCAVAIKPDNQLFNITRLNPKYAGEVMSEGQLSGFFRRLSNKLGFKISPHRLRHTMATEIARTGQIKPLQQILGHSDIRTTMNFYVHPSMEDLRSLLQTLG